MDTEDVLILDAPVEPAAAEPATCVGEIYEAKRLPVDIYFLVDISGSMAEETPSGPKWELVSRALVEFLEEPTNLDTGVGIGYFPLGAAATCMAGDDGCLCIPFTPFCVNLLGGSCEPADYGPSVPLALPPNPAPVVVDIGARTLSGGTPTRAALQGALDYAASWAEAHPERKTVVILATDGEPTSCTENSPEDVAAVAEAALQGPHQIRTFVVGVGSSLTSLNLVAEKGGTTEAFLTDTNENLAQELGAALNRIREQAVQCDFVIPSDSADGKIDVDLVNVRVTSAAGEPKVIPMTPEGDEAGCAEGEGWHYDDPLSPTSISLCEVTCQAAQGGALVQIDYGCETVRRAAAR
jgi:uncharacterized protein YegL